MARPRNDTGTKKISISTSPKVLGWLDELVATEVFGKTRTTVAETLLLEKLRDVLGDRVFKQGSENDD